MPNPTPVGLKLRELREAAGLTQRGLEERAGQYAGFTSAIESGKVQYPDKETLLAVAGALGCEAADLIVLVDYSVSPRGKQAARRNGHKAALKLNTISQALLTSMLAASADEVEAAYRVWRDSSRNRRMAAARIAKLLAGLSEADAEAAVQEALQALVDGK